MSLDEGPKNPKSVCDDSKDGYLLQNLIDLLLGAFISAIILTQILSNPLSLHKFIGIKGVIAVESGEFTEMIGNVKAPVIEGTVFVVNEGNILGFRVVNDVCAEEVIVTEDDGAFERFYSEFKVSNDGFKECHVHELGETFLFSGLVVRFRDVFEPLEQRFEEPRGTVSGNTIGLMPAGQFASNEGQMSGGGKLSVF